MHNIQELIISARAGNIKDFEKLVDIYQTGIYKMIFYRIRSGFDAEDITQDTFLHAFRKLHKLKKVDSFKSWLYRIALNKTRDFIRKKRVLSIFGKYEEADNNFNPDIDPDNTPDAIKILMQQDYWKRLNNCIDHFPKMEKEVFMLRFFDQLTFKEISTALAKKESTVKTHLYRGLKKLKNNSMLKSFLKENIS